MITIEDVQKLAKLSHLKLSNDELETYRKEIEAILGYIEQLQQADLEGIDPTYQVSGNKNVMRDDRINEDIYKTTQADLLINAPAKLDAQIKVKKVL
ncbi:MAG TPA: Asp-tRNA(Asn)/Glu-tRNA(Gln) amidotransferase subunit GatC [Candidatus Saccharibacteria bacterium]|nr:Asp-tRNA(Asn)/Glu-tRNA(Gln) amidotransferase subunit GatC [Candidatus Saccharibacteria bacterium]